MFKLFKPTLFYLSYNLHAMLIFAHIMCMNTHKKDRNQVRTAYHVARLGTEGAAAKFLGVHHAKVIRQVSNLE